MVTLADLVPKSRVISYSTDAGRLSLEQVFLTKFIVIKTNERERERIVDTTAFLQLQEFSQRNLPVASSTSAARLSLKNSREKLAWLSPRLQPYVLILT